MNKILIALNEQQVKALERCLEIGILATPTSPLRDAMTDVNILLMTAKDAPVSIRGG